MGPWKSLTSKRGRMDSHLRSSTEARIYMVGGKAKKRGRQLKQKAILIFNILHPGCIGQYFFQSSYFTSLVGTEDNFFRSQDCILSINPPTIRRLFLTLRWLAGWLSSQEGENIRVQRWMVHNRLPKKCGNTCGSPTIKRFFYGHWEGTFSSLCFRDLTSAILPLKLVSHRFWRKEGSSLLLT